jgi:hypothetical protein
MKNPFNPTNPIHFLLDCYVIGLDMNYDFD